MSRHARLILSLVLAASTVLWAGAGRPGGASSIVGAWTLNKDLSDTASEQARGENRGRRGGGFGRGRSGGYPGGGLGRGSGGDSEDTRRRTEAERAIMEAPERLTITQTDSLVIIVDGDGRTTRLSPDGKKIKDDATQIERKTKWDGDTLVTEITGAGPGKITESYGFDSDEGRLHITLQLENSRAAAAGVIHRVYDRLQDR
jgi:hypothetical protein